MTDYARAVTRSVNLRDKFSTFFSSFSTSLGHTKASFASGTKTILSRKRMGTLFMLVLIIGAAVLGGRVVLSRILPKSTSQLTAVSPDAVTVPIEREFSFQVYDQTKELANSVRYVITSAQLTKQIIIKGQKANAVAGRTFLILNLKLVNDFDKSLFLNTRNYVRVQPVGTEDKLAPEIHNDTVEVQPLSTKLTRIGLPVDEKAKEFVFHVGELEGEKQMIAIKFP